MGALVFETLREIFKYARACKHQEKRLNMRVSSNTFDSDRNMLRKIYPVPNFSSCRHIAREHLVNLTFIFFQIDYSQINLPFNYRV
jgi:hypothetical protein